MKLKLLFNNINYFNIPLVSTYYILVKFFIFLLLIPYIPKVNDEILANITSIIVCVFLISAIYFINKKHVSKKFLKILLFLFAVKILVSYAHFYWIFCPAAGISNALEAGYARFSGDLVAQHEAALQFLYTIEQHNIWFAVFGDYYRWINNPGVGIYYGILYGIFGPYPTVAYSFNAVVMFLASIFVYHLSHLTGGNLKFALTCGLLTMIMPSFFIMSPLYRDQVLILLITASVYALIIFIEKVEFFSFISMVLFIILLTSLRLSYILLLPFFLAMILFFLWKKRIIYLAIMLPILCGFAVSLQVYLIAALERKQMMSEVEITGVEKLGGGILGKIIFLIMTPFPWFQKANPAILAYQVFDYVQAWLSLAIIMYVIFFLLTNQKINKNQMVILVTFFVLFLLALMGSMLHQRYFQIAIPLLIPFLAMGKQRWEKQALTGSFTFFMFAHFIYYWI